MKLKLKTFRKRTMSSLVVLNPAGGSVHWEKIGAVVEIGDPQFAYFLLSEYGDMLEEVKEVAPPAPKPKTQAAPENKAVNAEKMKTKTK